MAHDAAALYHERMDALLKASQSLAAIESMDLLMPRLMELAEAVTVAQASSILLYDSTHEELAFWYARSGQGEAAAESILKSDIRLRLGEGIAGWVAQHRQSLRIEDVRADARFCQRADAATGFVTRDVICSPIIYQNQLMGVIQVLNARHKPHFDGDDARVLECFASLAAVSMVRAQLLEERLEQRTLETQLQTAAKLQSLFWPALLEPGHGSHIWTLSRPARFVGGDLHDVIQLPDGSLLCHVADVSGKGLPASLIMAAVWSQLRTQAYLAPDVGALLERVNGPLHQLLCREGYFVTCLACRYWPATGRLEAAVAGHPSPLWLGAKGRTPFPRQADAPLGVLPEVHYPVVTMHLSPGDSLVLHSDGLTEAMNEVGQRFEEVALEGVLETLANGLGGDAPGRAGPRGPLGPALIQALDAWRGAAQANDDLTVLEIWRQAG